MAWVHEKLYTDAWIVKRLEDDATLNSLISGVFNELIPSDRSLPAVRFHLHVGRDQQGVGTHRLTSRMTYLIVAVCRGNSPAPLVPIANRIDELLHGASGSSATIDVMSVVRTEPFSLSTLEDGVHYWHVGGMYEFQVNQK